MIQCQSYYVLVLSINTTKISFLLHSSRMRTARLLPVSPSMHCAGGGFLLGRRGVVPGAMGGGVCSRGAWSGPGPRGAWSWVVPGPGRCLIPEVGVPGPGGVLGPRGVPGHRGAWSQGCLVTGVPGPGGAWSWRWGCLVLGVHSPGGPSPRGVPGPGGCLVQGSAWSQGVPGPGAWGVWSWSLGCLVPGVPGPWWCLVLGLHSPGGPSPRGVPGPGGCLVPGSAWSQGVPGPGAWGAWSQGGTWSWGSAWSRGLSQHAMGQTLPS